MVREKKRRLEGVRLFFNFKANEKERVKGSNVVCYLRLRSFKQGGGGESQVDVSVKCKDFQRAHEFSLYFMRFPLKEKRVGAVAVTQEDKNKNVLYHSRSKGNI